MTNHRPSSFNFGDSGISSVSKGTHRYAAGLHNSGEPTDASATTCRGESADNPQAQEEGEGIAILLQRWCSTIDTEKEAKEKCGGGSMLMTMYGRSLRA